MKKAVNLFIIFSCVCVLTGCRPTAAEEPAEEVTAEPEEESTEGPPPLFQTIYELYAQYEQWLGTTVQVDGYFVDDNAPLLVDDLDLFLKNSSTPAESMLVLLRDKIPPQESGAYIRITGTLRIYENFYPEAIDVTDGEPFLILYIQDYEILDSSQLGIPDSDEMQTPYEIVYDTRAERDCIWALIISGSPYTFPGTGLTFVNHSRYWNDTLFAYQTVVRLGAQWVQVLYANGAAPAAFFGQLPGAIPAADLQAATRLNFEGALKTVGENIPDYCELWIISTDHGAGWEPPSAVGLGPGNNYLQSGLGRIDGAPADAIVPEGDLLAGDENDPAVLRVGNVVSVDYGDDVDEGLVLFGSILYDDSFRDAINNLNATLAERGIVIDINVMMEQCFSGGFIADLTIPIREITSIATAASEDQVSWSMGGWPIFDEFLYYFISALNGADPWGFPYPPAPLPVDSNANGIVEWNEAFDYANFMDRAAENPQYR